MNLLLIALCCILFTTMSIGAQPYHSGHARRQQHFNLTIIDDKASGSYGLVGEDISQNGYTDLVSFAYSGQSAGSTPGEIFWYEFLGVDNKGEYQWKKHLLTKKKHVVHGAFVDINHNGYRDLVFNSDFEVPVKNKHVEGKIWWAKRPNNLDIEQWDTFYIGQVAGAHRIVPLQLGDGKEQAILVLPLFSAGNKPLYGPSKITVFQPQNNNPELPWKKTVYAQIKLHATHDFKLIQFPSGQTRYLLITANEGLVKLSFYRNQKNEWQLKTEMLYDISSENSPKSPYRDKGFTVVDGEKHNNWTISGMTTLSEVDATQSLVAAIDYTKNSNYLADEPWHGDTLSIYEAQQPGQIFQGKLNRIVLEKRSPGGHAVELVEQPNKPGCPDVLAGFRVYPTALMYYTCHYRSNKDKTHRYYTKQMISERSANAIIIGNWAKDKLSFATVGYGYEGDPYVLMWTKE